MTVTVWDLAERELGEGWEHRALVREVDAAIEEEIRSTGLYQALSRSFTRRARELMAEREACFADVLADATDRILSPENELGRAVLAPLFIVDAFDALDIWPAHLVGIDYRHDGGPMADDSFGTAYVKVRPDFSSFKGEAEHAESETAVLLSLAEGCTRAEIAASIAKPRHVVESDAKALRWKLGARNDLELIALAYHHGILRQPVTRGDFARVT